MLNDTDIMEIRNARELYGCDLCEFSQEDAPDICKRCMED